MVGGISIGTSSPTRRDLCAIVREAFGLGLVSARRFRTGLCHYVYDAVLTDGRQIVLRIAKPENAHYLVGAVYWSAILKPLGVPLPELLHVGIKPGRVAFPYIVLQRLPGKDLGEVYSGLSRLQKRTLAHRLAAIQHTVGKMPEGEGFGYQSDPRKAPQHRTWSDAVEASIQRSERWIVEVGAVDGRRCARLRRAADRFGAYFSRVRPRPFLGDITTKNVLVERGKLVGIVDVDEVCFGDWLAHLGLTRMALLARKLPTDYVDFWCEALQLNEIELQALDFYTAESCLCFLGEQGRAFNQVRAATIKRSEIRRLEAIFDRLLPDRSRRLPAGNGLRRV
jgi:aminoglycoside phosphotransferase (APT) family kinase protein